MIVNWCTFYIRKGMKEMFCREMETAGLLKSFQDHALWYKLYLPADGSERVIAYQGWESAQAIEKHNTEFDMNRWQEIKKYYVMYIQNEGCEIDGLIQLTPESLSEHNKKPIAGWCTYVMYPNVREEFCRKAVMSGIYALCQNDAERFEFLLPWEAVSEVIILERWKNDAQMMKHCAAEHVRKDLYMLKKGYVQKNSCVGFRYDFLKDYGIR